MVFRVESPLRHLERHSASLVDILSNSTGRTLDTLYATFVHRIGLSQPFFKGGWGDLGVVSFEDAAELLEGWPPEHFDFKVNWQKHAEGRRYGTEYEILEGAFRTPCHGRLYDALPEESRTARVRLLQPKGGVGMRDCVVHLAGTGDHGFERRMNLGFPLIAKGVATMALESPYYGSRRPPWQEGSKLVRVSDLLTLGRTTIEESLYLLAWAQRQEYQRLGICGFSMGGVHACMVTSLYPKPLACVPLLAPRSAAVAFCHGALREATAWQPLLAAADEADKDVDATVLQAAQANLVTAAAQRVLQACKEAGTGPIEQVEDLKKLATAASIAPNGRASSEAFSSGATLAEQAASYLGKAEELLRWSADLRSLQIPLHLFSQSSSTAASSASASSKESSLQSDAASASAAAQNHVHSLMRSWLRFQRSQETLMARKRAQERLDKVLETYTDVTRFPRPQRPDAAVIVGAHNDAYVSAHSVRELAAHWPGSQVRWVPGGHVSAFLLQQPAFRKAILDSLERLSQPAAAVPDALSPAELAA
ncbi:g7877 [Coccomyxa elongata]